MIHALRKLFRKRWTDSDIEHFERMYRLEERQRLAREALGTRWACHPSKDVKRTAPKPRALYRNVLIRIDQVPTLRRVA